MTNRLRILIADDHRLVAELCKRLLEAEFDVVGMVGDGRETPSEAIWWLLSQSGDGGMHQYLRHPLTGKLWPMANLLDIQNGVGLRKRYRFE